MASTTETLIDAAKQRFDADGPQPAIQFLTSQIDKDAAMLAFRDLVKHAYWQRKDIPAVVQIADAAIGHCLRCAEEFAAANQTARSVAARKNARAQAYNLGSFCWPGWDESGVNLSPDAVDAGMRAAEQNLAFVHELELGDMLSAKAHWLLGAHYLTRGNYTEARRLFSKSAESAERASSVPVRLMADGFAHLAMILESSGKDISSAQHLEEIKRQLQPLEDI